MSRGGEAESGQAGPGELDEGDERAVGGRIFLIDCDHAVGRGRSKGGDP